MSETEKHLLPADALWFYLSVNHPFALNDLIAREIEREAKSSVIWSSKFDGGTPYIECSIRIGNCDVNFTEPLEQFLQEGIWFNYETDDGEITRDQALVIAELFESWAKKVRLESAYEHMEDRK